MNPTQPPPTPSITAGGQTANQLLEDAKRGLTRGSCTPAREALQELLSTYPNDPLVPEARLKLAETFNAPACNTRDAKAADSLYADLIAKHKGSPHVATALYRRGKQAEATGKPADAKRFYEQLVREYPQSDMAKLVCTFSSTTRPSNC